MKLSRKSYILAESGLQQAVCCDFVELGFQETPWGPKERVMFIFQTEQKHPDKSFLLTVNKRYNVSMHEKATLRQDIESWIGRSLTEKELDDGVDPEAFIGRGATINIVHNVSGDKTYANVKAVMPLPKGVAPAPIDPSYIRVKDREEGYDVRSPGSTSKANGQQAGPKPGQSDKEYFAQQDDELLF